MYGYHIRLITFNSVPPQASISSINRDHLRLHHQTTRTHQLSCLSHNCNVSFKSLAAGRMLVSMLSNALNITLISSRSFGFNDNSPCKLEQRAHLPSGLLYEGILILGSADPVNQSEISQSPLNAFLRMHIS